MTRISSVAFLIALVAACSFFKVASSFTIIASSCKLMLCRTSTIHSSSSQLDAGGWGNNQERSVNDAEVGGVNGSPIYDSYAIEDRSQFMQRVNNERKSLRIKKAADLLEVARIAGVELKRKEKDPMRLDLFDSEDLKSDDEYLDVSI